MGPACVWGGGGQTTLIVVVTWWVNLSELIEVYTQNGCAFNCVHST